MFRCFLLTLLCYSLSFSLNAKEFDLAFRYYNADGVADAWVATEVKTAGVELKKLQGNDQDAWQTWRLAINGELSNIELLFIGRKDSLRLSLQFHPESAKKITTLLLPRLQAGELKYTVSKYSCKWQGGIASPLDLNLSNRLDGKYLELKDATCADSMSGTIYMNGASDSLLLILDVASGETFGFKYYLSSDNQLKLLSTMSDQRPTPSINAWWLALETSLPLKIIYLKSGVIIYNEQCQFLFEDNNQIRLIKD